MNDTVGDISKSLTVGLHDSRSKQEEGTSTVRKLTQDADRARDSFTQMIETTLGGSESVLIELEQVESALGRRGKARDEVASVVGELKRLRDMASNLQVSETNSEAIANETSKKKASGDIVFV